MINLNSFKKIGLSGVVVLAFVFYVIHERGESRVARAKIPSSKLATSLVSPTKQVGMAFKDGSYISSVTDAFFGPLQIKVEIANGKIHDVKFLQFPNDRPTSIEISNISLPILRSEAISSQKAEVDIVSGATQTSEAFQAAMKEVLDKAK
jgi:uncharacterized protein with FMN-binding domain